MNNAESLPARHFLKWIILFALLHYGALLGLGGLIFFASHLPPKVVQLDGLIVVLVNVEQGLVAPRKFLLWLYPGESTPGWLGVGTTLLNSLAWGIGLAGIKTLLRR